MNLRPYIDFSPQTPKAVSIFFASSEASGIASLCLSRNLSCAFTGSAETPTTSVSALAKAFLSPLNAIDSLVQPGVSALG